MTVKKIGCKIVRSNTEGRKFEQSCWLLVLADICFLLSVIRVQSVSAKIHISTSLELIIFLSSVGVQENVLTDHSPIFTSVLPGKVYQVLQIRPVAKANRTKGDSIRW